MKKILTVIMGSCLAFASAAQVQIEYIGHASFILESSEGTRLAIDPYNGKHSLGYYFPDNLVADAVAITHPHFDHDASYYFGAQTPRLTQPGRYEIEDIQVIGIQAEHAGAPRFRDRGAEPYNTIWKAVVDDITVVHLGDNGLMDDDMLLEIGDIDILLIQVFEDHHFYNDEEFDRVINSLSPSVIIPMHYRLTEISEIPSWTGDVDPWLSKRNGVRHDDNVLIVAKGDLKEQKIVKLKHSPSAKPWDTEMMTSWDEFTEVRSKFYGGDRDFNLLSNKMGKVVERSPEVLIYHNLQAQLLDSLGRGEEVVELLTKVLANSGLDDWEQEIIARTRLARYYIENGKMGLAAEQYQWILGQPRTYQQKLLDEAEAFLSNRDK